MMNTYINPRFAVENQYKKFSRDEIAMIFKHAHGQWINILDSTGINPSFLKNKHGPCPICGGKDRFRFDDKGKGAFICSHCGAGYGIKLLQLYHNWNFQQALDMVARILRIRTSPYTSSQPTIASKFISNRFSTINSIDIEKRKHALNHLWLTSVPVKFNDPVDRYLQSRGLRLNAFPTTLRFHPQLPYYENGKLQDTLEAMIALVTDQKNQIVTIHRTYLKNGLKADITCPKKLMPTIQKKSMQGTAIKLYDPTDGKLALAEGIETALSYYVLSNIPVWATVNAHGLEKVNIPDHVKNITILIDNDASKTGQKSALTLLQRLKKNGHEVTLMMPPKQDYDFNDLLMESCV